MVPKASTNANQNLFLGCQANHMPVPVFLFVVVGGLGVWTLTRTDKKDAADESEARATTSGTVTKEQRMQDPSPRIEVLLHYGEGLRSAVWTGQQDVGVQVEVIDCGVVCLNQATSRVCQRGGTSPIWSGDVGKVTVTLPARELRLWRLELRVRLWSKHALIQDSDIGDASLGRVGAVADGIPRTCDLWPQGKLTYSARTADVQDAPCFSVELPCATAFPVADAAVPSSQDICST